MDLTRNLKTETVSRLHPTQAWLVQATQPVADAVKLMREKRVGCVLVCEQRRIVGIFTERDLLRRVLSQGKPLATPMQECMTPNPVTVHPKDPISLAIKVMQKGGYRHLPVVIDDKPVGILSVKRIVHYLVEHFPTMVYNLPPHPQPIQPKREGALNQPAERPEPRNHPDGVPFMATHEPRLAKDTARSAAPKAAPAVKPRGPVEERDALTVRFAGDAGDGVHLIGAQFTLASASHGNAVCTLPDPPAEIRAPAGTLAGVSAFQVHFSKHPIHTPGEQLDALLAMNPAALSANLVDLVPQGLLIVNADAFTQDELDKAGYVANPLTDESLKAYRVVPVPMNRLNRESVARVTLSPREAERCKSFFVLGLTFWLFDRPLDSTLQWIRDTYIKNPAMIEANTRALKAGHQCGETLRPQAIPYHVAKAQMPAGRYRNISGTEALALGLLAAAHQTGLPMVFAGFPLTPASELLHQLCEEKQPNVKVIQAEDDIAALNLALGASFGGALGVTATTGPGLSLQADALGLAVMSELPCVVIDVQRAGPSTGMPSKSEQADLLLALNGRHGECPLIVLAPATPADGFAIVLEATRLAIRYMTPVIVLTDASLARGAEIWRVQALDELPALEVRHASAPHGGAFLPYQRDERQARPWAIPGTPGLEHRTGGLEKEDLTGAVSYDPLNHEKMVQARAAKIAAVADEMPLLEVQGPAEGDLLVLGWGSTYGAIAAAVKRCQGQGLSVASAHLRHLHPLPRNTGELLKRYRKVLVPELNGGQLCSTLRSRFLVDAISLSKVQGRPFLVSEIEAKIKELV